MGRQSTKSRPPRSTPTRYQDDLYTWVQEQVALLRAGRVGAIDAANIAEELADARSKLVLAMHRGYSAGRDRALDETGLADAALPEGCPYAFTDIMTREIVFAARPKRTR